MTIKTSLKRLVYITKVTWKARKLGLRNALAIYLFLLLVKNFMDALDLMLEE